MKKGYYHYDCTLTDKNYYDFNHKIKHDLLDELFKEKGLEITKYLMTANADVGDRTLYYIKW